MLSCIWKTIAWVLAQRLLHCLSASNHVRWQGRYARCICTATGYTFKQDLAQVCMRHATHPCSTACMLTASAFECLLSSLGVVSWCVMLHGIHLDYVQACQAEQHGGGAARACGDLEQPFE